MSNIPALAHHVYPQLAKILGLPEENVVSCTIKIEVNKIVTADIRVNCGMNDGFEREFKDLTFELKKNDFIGGVSKDDI